MVNNKMNWGRLSLYRNELYGLCIVWIMLFHSYLTGSSCPGFGNRIIAHGNFAVDIFFFLSGVSLCFAVEKKKTSLFCYYQKRLERIYKPLTFDILYWVVCLVTGSITVSGFLSRAFCLEFWLTGDQQIWFLSVILLMYFIFPYVYSFIYGEQQAAENKSDRTVLLKAYCLIVFLFLVIFLIKLEATSFYDQTKIGLARIPVFVLGVAYGRKVIFKKNLETIDYILSALMFLCAGLLVLVKHFMNIPFFSDLPNYYLYFFLTLPTMIVLTIFVSVFKIRALSLIFNWFGKISIELYIVQMTMIELYKRSIPYKYTEGSFLKYLGIMAISILIAYCLHSAILYLQKQFSCKRTDTHK